MKANLQQVPIDAIKINDWQLKKSFGNNMVDGKECTVSHAVKIPSQPYPDYPKEEERLTSLQSYNLLDTAAETDFDELVQLASEICGTPIALITLVDKNRQWFKGNIGLEVSETPRAHAFCAHTIVDPSGVMQICDARLDRRFAKNPLVINDPNIVFYAGISLVNQEGMPLGTLCVIDRIPKQLNTGQLKAMKTLAKQVMAQMELRRQVATLIKRNRQLAETNDFMQRFATTAAHDIKNPLSSISLSAQMLIKHLGNNNDERGLRFANTTLQCSKQLASLVNGMLEYSMRPEILTQKQQSFELLGFLKNIISMITVPENVTISLPETELTITVAEIALQQVIINLLTNAIRYNDKPICKISITAKKVNDLVSLSVEDNGVGIDKVELERIFERNVTLNLPDRFKQNGTGIGLHTVKVLLEKIGGTIYVKSEKGMGSCFIFSIPNCL
ncbi:MAG: sensor histidine kinase [Flavobacteriales bacterium]|nr:MAG: sensor histidine kinase [Flavobacteriales bacterium]